MNLFRNAGFFLWISLILTLASCSPIKSDSNSPVIIEIDTLNCDHIGPVDIDSYGLEFTEFYCQREVEHFETWRSPVIRNEKLIFYNIEGAKKENQYFAVFNEGDANLVETFETNVDWGRIEDLHYFESTNNYILLYFKKRLGIYDNSLKEFQVTKTEWSFHSGIANSDTTMIALGVDGPDKEQVPSLIEISDKGEIGQIKSFPDRALSKSSAHSEKLFFYENNIYWFSRKDLTLYKVDQDFNINPVLKITARDIVSYEEESDPYKYDPLRFSKFANRTYVQAGLKLMGDYLILHLKIDKKSFTLVVNLLNMEYQLNKNFRLTNKMGILISTYVGNPPSISVATPIIEDYEDRIFKNAISIPEYRGPSVIYIK